MSKLAVFVGLMLLIGILGCAGFDRLAKPDLNFKDPEMAELYGHYQVIDPENLTVEQQQLLQRFNALELTEKDKNWIRGFPWLNPETLSNKDKVFVMEIAREVAAAMRISDTSAASAANH